MPDGLHSSLGMLRSSDNDIQKRKIQNLIHSLSSIGLSVSMEMPLAKAYLKVSHIIERSYRDVLGLYGLEEDQDLR